MPDLGFLRSILVNVILCSFVVVSVAEAANHARSPLSMAAYQMFKQGKFQAALNQFQPQAEKGEPFALLLIGEIYKRGLGVKPDFVLAAEYYGRAAESERHRDPDVALAQFNLGAMYWNGEGVEKSADKAAQFYRRAAINGYIQAQTNLIAMYNLGEGVEKSPQKAIMWAMIAAAEGHKKARKMMAGTLRTTDSAVIDEARTAAVALMPELERQIAALTAPKLSLNVTKGLGSGPPVSRSAGFTEEFERIYRRPESDNELVIKELESQLTNLNPPHLYELSRRYFTTDKEKAVGYFWLARYRGMYDAGRCTDRTAAQGVGQWVNLLKDVVKHIQSNPDISTAGKKFAFEKEKEFPADNLPRWICFHGMRAVIAAQNGQKFENWVTPQSTWAELRLKNRAQMEKAISQ